MGISSVLSHDIRSTKTEGHRFESCRARFSGRAESRLSKRDLRLTRDDRLEVPQHLRIAVRAWHDHRADYRAPLDGRSRDRVGSMISTVAVGTDGSTTADEAVKQAAEIARRFDARLVLLSAFDYGDGAPVGEDIELQWASNPSARVKSMLERTGANLRSDGIECETQFGGGEPAEVLVRLATDCGADLLVIGNKGIQRRVLGSVPNSVTHKADCSVLVVKTT